MNYDFSNSLFEEGFFGSLLCKSLAQFVDVCDQSNCNQDKNNNKEGGSSVLFGLTGADNAIVADGFDSANVAASVVIGLVSCSFCQVLLAFTCSVVNFFARIKETFVCIVVVIIVVVPVVVVIDLLIIT